MGRSDGKRVASVNFTRLGMFRLAQRRAASLNLNFSKYVERLVLDDLDRGGPLEVKPMSSRLLEDIEASEDASSSGGREVGRIAALNDAGAREPGAPVRRPVPTPTPVIYRRPGRAGGSRGDNAGSAGRKD